MDTATPIEHRRGRIAGALHERRRRLVLWVVLAEGILVLFGAVPWWAVVLLAAGAFAFYVAVGRAHARGTLREASWIAAVSQLVVLLVPLLALVVTAVAVVALVAVALGVLALVVLDRR